MISLLTNNCAEHFQYLQYLLLRPHILALNILFSCAILSGRCDCSLMNNLMKCFPFHTCFSDVKSSPVSEGEQAQPLDLKCHSLLLHARAGAGVVLLIELMLQANQRCGDAKLVVSQCSSSSHLFAYFPPSSGSFFSPTLPHSSSRQDSFSSLFLNYYFRPICLSCNMKI